MTLDRESFERILGSIEIYLKKDYDNKDESSTINKVSMQDF